MRKIKVASTKMSSPKDIDSSAKTWGELKSDLSKAGIEYTGMSAVVRENKANLELDDALLPETNITLFLMPKKSKGGTKPKAAAKKAPAKKTTIKKTGVVKVVKKAPVKKEAPKKTTAKKESDTDVMSDLEKTRRQLGL